MYEASREQRAHVQAAINVFKNVLEPHDLPSRHSRLVEN
jgi:hypothetical protein